MMPLFDACRRMLRSRARRIPLIDVDDETQQEMVVSVLTQFRILKFIAFNVRETKQLRKPLHELGVVTEREITTAQMDTPVMAVIHMLVRGDISSVPIVDSNGSLSLALRVWSLTDWVCRDLAQHLRIGRHLDADQERLLSRLIAQRGRGSAKTARRKRGPTPNISRVGY